MRVEIVLGNRYVRWSDGSIDMAIRIQAIEADSGAPRVAWPRPGVGRSVWLTVPQ